MDEQLESLRRALRTDPEDFGVARRLASALEKTGGFDGAWEALEGFSGDDERRRTLAALARRHPRALLARLERLDYRSLRLTCELLVGCGEAAHPALICLATRPQRDLITARIVARAIAHALPQDLQTLAESPEQLRFMAEPAPSGNERTGELEVRRLEGRAFVERVIERGGSSQMVALLPWLVPLLAARDAELAARALGLVHRLTHKDGPPFDVDLLAQLLESNEGEAA